MTMSVCLCGYREREKKPCPYCKKEQESNRATPVTLVDLHKYQSAREPLAVDKEDILHPDHVFEIPE